MPDPKRRYAEVTLETVDLRLTALEDWQEQFADELSATRREVQANTRLVEEIHGNTAEIVEVTQDIKVFIKWGKRLAKPAAFLGAFGIAAAVYFKTGKWVWPA